MYENIEGCFIYFDGYGTTSAVTSVDITGNSRHILGTTLNSNENHVLL